jgi:hypothetical protein
MPEYTIPVTLTGTALVTIDAPSLAAATQEAKDVAEIGEVNSWTPSVEPTTRTLYRVVVTIKSPVSEPVEIPYCQATTDRCTAIAALTSAFDLHSTADDRWTAFVSARIDAITEEI